MAEHKHAWLEDKLLLVLWCSPAIALLLWDFVSSKRTARSLLDCYVLIAAPFFALSGSYPPAGSRWFWKAMIPICALIGVGVYGNLQLVNWLDFENVNLSARMTFGVTGAVAILEAICACRIVDATEPRINNKE